jgi:hypothetical protein
LRGHRLRDAGPHRHRLLAVFCHGAVQQRGLLAPPRPVVCAGSRCHARHGHLHGHLSLRAHDHGLDRPGGQRPGPLSFGVVVFLLLLASIFAFTAHPSRGYAPDQQCARLHRRPGPGDHRSDVSPP